MLARLEGGYRKDRFSIGAGAKAKAALDTAVALDSFRFSGVVSHP